MFPNSRGAHSISKVGQGVMSSSPAWEDIFCVYPLTNSGTIIDFILLFQHVWSPWKAIGEKTLRPRVPRCRPAFDLMVVTLIVEAVKATITRKTLMLAIMYFSIKLYRFQLNCFRYFPSFYSKFNVVSDKKKSSRGALRIILCTTIT